jgi:hypothetical protein
MRTPNLLAERAYPAGGGQDTRGETRFEDPHGSNDMEVAGMLLQR